MFLLDDFFYEVRSDRKEVYLVCNTFRSLDYQKLSSAAIIMSIAMVIIIGILFVVENWFGKDVEG